MFPFSSTIFRFSSAFYDVLTYHSLPLNYLGFPSTLVTSTFLGRSTCRPRLPHSLDDPATLYATVYVIDQLSFMFATNRKRRPKY